MTLCFSLVVAAPVLAQEGAYGPEPRNPNQPQPTRRGQPERPPQSTESGPEIGPGQLARSGQPAPSGQPTEFAQLTEPTQPDVPPADFEVPPAEPISPREALFLAIELRDVDAALVALRNDADVEISRGNPSPLATAALHDDARMVALLLSFGGNPGTTKDSPLEEGVRNENLKIVDLLLRSGATVPAGKQGVEMFRLAQRGSKAIELSKALLDHGGNPNLCLTAATRSARIGIMRYCLSRGANVSTLPADLNILSVALRSEDAAFIGQVLGYGLEDRVVAGALSAAVAVGNMDVVQRAIARGAVPVFDDIEAAVENRQAEIGSLLLVQTEPGDGSVLEGGDVEGLIQQAEDLGLSQIAAAVRRKSGRSAWTLERLLPWVLGGGFAVGLIILLLRNLNNSAPKVSIAGGPALTDRRVATPAQPSTGWPQAAPGGAQDYGVTPDPVSPDPIPPNSNPPRPVAPLPAAQGPAPALGTSMAPPLATPAVASPAPAAVSMAASSVPPAAAVPPVAAPVMPAAEPVAPAVGSARGELPELTPAGLTPAELAPAQAATLEVAPVPAAPVETVGVEAWAVAPNVSAPTSMAPPRPMVVAPQAQPSLDVKMPEVDLSHPADRVFAAVRQAAASVSQQPETLGRRHVALVTPSRVTMLHPCPAPGSLGPEQTTLAEGLVPSGTSRNVAVIGYNELEATKADISMAVPFFGLLQTLGYLGHSVWIFEGHVSAMGAGCQDADVLIVDDGMMRHLPGNWRSVAMRVMRGPDIYAFERRSGNLRRMK